ncbi:sensor domain-containing protein [Streptomyces aurantiacus]|uniref:sensor domain-containing protein n=1 Tax=Streptomyces aurantiacus TaxID=47760 RepID=UPI00040F54D0|nr:sensor domain-containing protein [Streptomyces aurantiacus]
MNRTRKATQAFRRTLALWADSHRAFWLSLWLMTVSSMLRGPVGLKLLPGTVRQVRALADRQRAHAAAWTGVDIPAVYAELPPTGAGQAKALRAQLLDKGNQVHRDWRWVHVDAFAGGTIAAGPLVLLLTGLWGLRRSARSCRPSGTACGSCSSRSATRRRRRWRVSWARCACPSRCSGRPRAP